MESKELAIRLARALDAKKAIISASCMWKT